MGCGLECGRCDPRTHANCGFSELNAFNVQDGRMEVKVYESHPVNTETPVMGQIIGETSGRSVPAELTGQSVVTPWHWFMQLIGRR